MKRTTQAGIALLLIGAAVSGYPRLSPDEPASDVPARAPVRPTPTAADARLEAALLMDDGNYLAAVEVLESAGLHAAAARARRLGARKLLVAASEALGRTPAPPRPSSSR